MGTTPEYTKKAINKYQAGKDRVNLLLEKGTKDRIKEKYGDDISITAYIKDLIDNDLNKTEQAQDPEDEKPLFL